MADTSATAHVFPSANDVRGSLAAGWGKTMYELNVGAYLAAALHQNNFVLSGLVIPASSASLSITVPLGVAFINGRYVAVDAQSITVGASVTSFLFLKLMKDANNNISSVQFEVNTTNVVPSDSTPIAQLVSSGSAITSTVDMRIIGPSSSVSVPAGTYNVPAGITRIKVKVYGASGGGGGGGGGGYSGGSGPVAIAGSPGEIGRSGGYTEGFFVVTPGASYTITLGAAGSAGSGGAASSGAATHASGGGAGGAGGSTSFGALCSAGGGGGGTGGSGGNNTNDTASSVISGLPGSVGGGPGNGASGTVNISGGGHQGGAGGAGGAAGTPGATGSNGTAGTGGTVIVEYV